MGTFRVQVPNALERTALVLSLGLLTGLAWLVLRLTHSTSHRLLHPHHHLMASGQATGALPLLFLAGWIVMTAAMMLPTTLPLVLTFFALVRERADRVGLVTLLIAGYMTVWAAFGGLVYLGNLVTNWFVAVSPWLQRNQWAGGAGLVLLAGLFQFSSLKYRCLDKCRSPLSFVIEHWHGQRHRRQALRLGIVHGLFCVGCCWALMLLMFVASITDLLWMLILGLVMAIEKNVPWGRRMSAPLGILLLAWGMVLLAVA